MAIHTLADLMTCEPDSETRLEWANRTSSTGSTCLGTNRGVALCGRFRSREYLVWSHASGAKPTGVSCLDCLWRNFLQTKLAELIRLNEVNSVYAPSHFYSSERAHNTLCGRYQAADDHGPAQPFELADCLDCTVLASQHLDLSKLDWRPEQVIAEDAYAF
jgi:hypothetical protein